VRKVLQWGDNEGSCLEQPPLESGCDPKLGSYTNWGAQPPHATQLPSGCSAAALSAQGRTTDVWNLKACTEELLFVCQAPYNPPPTAIEFGLPIDIWLPGSSNGRIQEDDVEKDANESYLYKLFFTLLPSLEAYGTPSSYTNATAAEACQRIPIASAGPVMHKLKTELEADKLIGYSCHTKAPEWRFSPNTEQHIQSQDAMYGVKFAVVSAADSTARNWFDADAACRAADCNAMLASVFSSEEEEWLVNDVIADAEGEFWIGCSNQASASADHVIFENTILRKGSVYTSSPFVWLDGTSCERDAANNDITNFRAMLIDDLYNNWADNRSKGQPLLGGDSKTGACTYLIKQKKSMEFSGLDFERNVSEWKTGECTRPRGYICMLPIYSEDDADDGSSSATNPGGTNTAQSTTRDNVGDGSDSSKQTTSGGVVAGGVLGGLVVLVCIGLLVVRYKGQLRHRQQRVPKEATSEAGWGCFGSHERAIERELCAAVKKRAQLGFLASYSRRLFSTVSSADEYSAVVQALELPRSSVIFEGFLGSVGCSDLYR
jgi:hypothetical protein